MKAKEVTLGVHLVLDGWGSPFAVLDDPQRVRAALEATAAAAGLTLLQVATERFAPQGVTVVGLLAESHVAIHTWPEHGAFAADLFHCGTPAQADLDRAAREITTRLEATHCDSRTVERIAPRRDADSLGASS